PLFPSYFGFPSLAGSSCSPPFLEPSYHRGVTFRQHMAAPKRVASLGVTLIPEAVLPFTDGQDNETAVATVLAGRPVVLRYPGLVDATINFISGFLWRLLSQFDLGFMSELLLVLLKELTSNCSKASAKRIFFESKKLDA